MRYKLLGLIIIVLIIAGVLLYLNFRNAPLGTNQGANTPSPSASGLGQTPAVSVSPIATVTASSVETPKPDKILEIDVDDSGAGKYQSSTKRGALVSLTSKVMANNVSSGGLDFRSSVISTGPILPGQAKTITFVANDTVVFTPYGISPNTPKPYTITINVY